jgi:hypothetical protein
MLIATILGVCLIPMLYVATERVIGKLSTPSPDPGSHHVPATAHSPGGR